MSDFRGILNSNVTDAGGQLSEDAFMETMGAIARPPERLPAAMIASPRVVERAQSDIARAEIDADAALREVYRLRRGWRRLRFVARSRAAERYIERQRFAASLAATFGRARG